MLCSLVVRWKHLLCLVVLAGLPASCLVAQSTGTLRGKVTDPLGAPVAGASVVLLQGDQEIASGVTDGEGSFQFAAQASGLYAARVAAQGFAAQTIREVSVSEGKTAELNILLRVGPLAEKIVVSATGKAIPQSQVGASVSLIDREEIETQNKLDVLENLRYVPGAQIVQSGQRGATTSLFIRGGESNFNKVLVDGIPVNALGGAFDFAQLSSTGVDSIEVLRGANSVLYGSDALGSVVNITSQRGMTSTPELKYSVDGGNFGTLNEDVSVGGTLRSFDYFSEFSRFDTQGSMPNNYFHNATVSANLGWSLNPTTGIRATVRHGNAENGNPNAISFFGIADDSRQSNESTYAGVTAQHQTTERWHNSVQFAFSQFASVFANPSPTGEPFDPFGSGPNYLGNTVTIRGANGYSVTGQAILDFGGVYPEAFPTYEARRSVYAQSDYRFWSDWTGIAGFRYEHEDGEGLTRNNYSGFLEAHGSFGHRLFVTGGVGLENNAVFGFAGSPRVSLAYYLRRPTGGNFLGETKLKFNFGKGIKEPSTSQQASALINLLTPAQVAEFAVSPVGPERSKTTDFGIEQGLWNGRAILGLTLFYNKFYDLISFLDTGSLISIGVSPDAANASPLGGAYVNATSERMLGAEVEFKTDIGHGFLFQGQYTYLDGVITKAFGLAAFNPEFPTIPIGAFSPLEGARPFRRAPHSGSFSLTYVKRRFSGAFTGYLVGRRDDSTFLSDGFFGNSMLLPNRNLSPAYQKFDLSGAFRLTSYARVYTSIENLFSQHYEPVIGFPAAPFTIRSGVTITLGGREGWPKR